MIIEERKIKENFISLDLSSTVCGYTVIINSDIKEVSFYEFRSEDLVDRANELKSLLEEKLKDYIDLNTPIKTMVIEANMKAFKQGKSSGDAMFKTGQMNFLGRYLCKYCFGLNIISLNVISARNVWYPGFTKLSRTMKGVKDKELAFEIGSKQLLEIGIKMPTKILKSGPRKGQEVFLDEAGDMVDSYVLAMAYKKQ